MSWILGPQLQSEKHTPKYLIRAYSSSLADKGRLRDDNTDYNFLSKSKRIGRIKTCSIGKIQCVSGKQKNSSGIQIKKESSKEEGNSQRCIDTACCMDSLVCVSLPVSFASCTLLFIKDQSTRREIRGEEERKKGEEEEKPYAYVRPSDIAFQGSCTVISNFYDIKKEW